jgi:hypothetical protein
MPVTWDVKLGERGNVLGRFAAELEALVVCRKQGLLLIAVGRRVALLTQNSCDDSARFHLPIL